MIDRGRTTGVLVDSNVLLDVIVSDAVWSAWSSRAIADVSSRSVLLVNPIVYAEVSIGFERPEEVDAALSVAGLQREALPWEAAFIAGKAFREYRRRGGDRRSPLPDFYIGAHAEVRGYTLLTRDAARYRTYFPAVTLVTP